MKPSLRVLLLAYLLACCSGCFLSEQINGLGPDLFILNSIPLSQAEIGCKLA